MGFDEGRIIVDSDNGAYYAGQTVQAKLVFDLDKVKTFRGTFIRIFRYQLRLYYAVQWIKLYRNRLKLQRFKFSLV